MNRILVVLSLILWSGTAAASTTIVCSKDSYLLGVTESTIGGRGHGSMTVPVFVLHENNRVVGAGNLKLVEEGYEGTLLNAYLWTFQSHDSNAIIGVGVKGLTTPAPGTYKGSADIFVTVGGHTMDGSTIPCEVTIK